MIYICTDKTVKTMITFPCAKINLGLNVVAERQDGYHDIETVFYPVNLTDALEIKLMSDEFPSDVDCDLKVTGNAVDCDERSILVVSGRGEILEPADEPKGNLDGYYMAIVKPDIAVSTGQAYKEIVCHKPAKCCRDVVRQPIETWKDALCNDFEKPVFKAHPELSDIKGKLYKLGASYAQMSGSGSALFGIFRNDPLALAESFPEGQTFTVKL